MDYFQKKYYSKCLMLVISRFIPVCHFTRVGGSIMLRWVLIFLVVAIIAGILGFTGIAAAAADIARIVFMIFLVLFIVSLVMHLIGRSRLP
jgi:uncharacterized membrane protein YtjA (UPF0391 family)